jgi:hypothetical protein
MGIGFGLVVVVLAAMLAEMQRLVARQEPRGKALPDRGMPDRAGLERGAWPTPVETRVPHPPADELFAPDEPNSSAPADAPAAPAEAPPWAIPPREARLPEPPPAPARPPRRDFSLRRPPAMPADDGNEHTPEHGQHGETGMPPGPPAAAAPQGNMFDSLGPKRPDERVVRKPFRLRPGAPADQSAPESAAPSAPAAFESSAPMPDEPVPAAADTPPVVLKSGVIDGMAYSLFSDGSIEAELADGTIRFASLDELRAHLDRRA